jgi:hypothetical protein
VSTPDIAAATAAQAAAMATENRRRELASQSPGLGAPVSLPDVPYGPGVGLTDIGLPHVGESYGQGAAVVPQVKSYGPAVPVYADPLVGGVSYGPGHVQTAIRSLGERVFAAQDGQAGIPYTVISPAVARPSLWQRITGKLRRH